MAIKKGLICTDENLNNGVYPYTQTDCVFDENGNSLDGLLLYHGNGVDTTLDTLPIDMDLLYRNDQPTATFNTQTFQIDFSSYEYVLIQFVTHTTLQTENFTLLCKVGARSELYAVTTQIRKRFVTVNSNSIFFDVGTSVTTYNTVGNTDNNSCIPLKVYGLKFNIHDLTS